MAALRKLGCIDAAKRLRDTVDKPSLGKPIDGGTVNLELSAADFSTLKHLIHAVADCGSKADKGSIVEALSTSLGSEKNPDEKSKEGGEENEAIVNHFLGQYSKDTVRTPKRSSMKIFRKHAKRIGLAAVLSKRLSRRRTSLIDSSKELKKSMMLKAGILALPEKVDEALESIELWGFDVFRIGELLQRPLLAVGFSALHQAGDTVLSSVSCDSDTILEFLLALDKGYKDLPYHNSTHAADVVQTTFYFLRSGGLGEFITDWQKFSLLIAAASHDVGHPGVNNAYLACTSHPLALTYNDLSTLENMHAATAFKIMREVKNADVIGNIGSNALKNSVRRAIIDMILATDMANHVEHLTELENLVESTLFLNGDAGSEMDNFWLGKGGEAVLRTAIHAADVSNPAKPFDTYMKWTNRVMEEFYDQADQERKLNVSGRGGLFGFLNRSTPIPDWKFQLGFINGVVMPLYKIFASVPGLRLSECTDQLQENKLRWDREKPRKDD